MDRRKEHERKTYLGAQTILIVIWAHPVPHPCSLSCLPFVVVTIHHQLGDRPIVVAGMQGGAVCCGTAETAHSLTGWLGIGIVKIVDRSYLTKHFNIGDNKQQVDNVVFKFDLNTEQERAFWIVANHAVCQQPEQLKMYLGGMGGTGKSRIIKALSEFFAVKKEAHRFVIVAPTGTAAALLGGSTYHYMFGIIDFFSGSGLSKIKACLSGVEYVFLMKFLCYLQGIYTTLAHSYH